MDISDVVLTSYGYYESKNKPTQLELDTYYSNKYYQDNKGSYHNVYSDEELIYINNKIEQKYFVIESRLKPNGDKRSFLDVGCGEGFAMKYFHREGWDVIGLDFSDDGCRRFNVECLPFLIKGNIYANMTGLLLQHDRFDIIWLDNCLEHVLHPLELLKQCSLLLKVDGILIIEVPNDFSSIQSYLLHHNKVPSPFWIVFPDHISYFNAPGLKNLLTASGFATFLTIGDFPIDHFLMNPDSNYILDSTKGKNCHDARMHVENILHSISVPRAIEYYKALSDLGMGRQIVSFSELTT